jgi:hypothetical protein
MKTQYARGHFKQALEKLELYLDELDEKYDLIEGGDKLDCHIEYLFYKLVYIKCKFQRKVRLLSDCEETCNFLIDQVKDSKRQPQLWWKFALKAAYIKTILLGAVMEFAKPKALFEGFIKSTLIKFLKHFATELDFEASELPSHKYTFEYRRFFAKFRRLSYFVP